MCNPGWTANDGLVTLRNGMPEVMRRLDAAFLRLSEALQAREVLFPSITPVSQLVPIDYFRNFPHLGLAVGALKASAFGDPLEHASADSGCIDADCLNEAHYMLPSAACYPIYAQYRDQTLSTPQFISTVQRCFRNENHYDGMQRLLGFTMREIVVLGSFEEVRDYLDIAKGCVLALAEGAGLELEIQKAQDPFFNASDARSRTQKLLGLKLELVFAGNLAISSVNSHLGFFGERWGIRLSPTTYAFSGCIAFGLERWLHALSVTHHGEPADMLRAIESGERAALSRFGSAPTAPQAREFAATSAA